jgi:hypothetical protein
VERVVLQGDDQLLLDPRAITENTMRRGFVADR